MITTSEVV
jgi:hypothetical protein